MNNLTGPPAPRPCDSCPYRRDVPSGIWSAEEYGKLRNYDGPTYWQPLNLFLCHQHDAESEQARLCAGWVGCHGSELLAPRLALRTGSISEATHRAVLEYQSPVPLFASGAEAAEHGTAEIHCPSAEAARAVEKISRRRGFDL